jgi:hypothetical protein
MLLAGRPVAESDPEAGGQQDGEDEYPEDGLRLTHELLVADERELDKRTVEQPAPPAPRLCRWR